MASWKLSHFQERLWSMELHCMISFLYFPVSDKHQSKIVASHLTEADYKLDFNSSCWRQIRILTYRMLLQTCRDKVSHIFTEQFVAEEALVQIQAMCSHNRGT
jgi:hypothetical protein